MQQPDFMTPDWPAPDNIGALATTRVGGISQGAYASLNLGDHVGDDPAAELANRAELVRCAAHPGEPVWLEQVHGTTLAPLPADGPGSAADSAWTAEAGTVCAVMTADCLPVLMCTADGSQVAALHAGWRGLCAGVLEATVARFTAAGAAPEQLLVWLGPAIGAAHYEVDATVYDAFAAAGSDCSRAFVPSRPGHWQLDLYAAAGLRLAAISVTRIWGGAFCTYADTRFFSHRREAPCGRQATLIWRHHRP